LLLLLPSELHMLLLRRLPSELPVLLLLVLLLSKLPTLLLPRNLPLLRRGAAPELLLLGWLLEISLHPLLHTRSKLRAQNCASKPTCVP
jgi:hypothetical protein